MFIETTTSEQFLEKSEHFKNVRGRIRDNNRLGPEGYAGKEKGKWRKEDAAMEEAGSENPWRQFPGRSAPYLRARAAPTPSTGEITWSSNDTKRLADRVIELKDHESGVREHDILSTAIDTLEHSAWSLQFEGQLNKESKERGLGVAFIDPQHFSATVIAQDPDHKSIIDFTTLGPLRWSFKWLQLHHCSATGASEEPELVEP
ncbi:hypothetical protein C2845_PM15G03370 [Panicum miliaceum]|uniref:Uncharacterized protein n=1 Tax=Panicum miliaceum TaxID=4540 RepID=A0A3L6Q4P8_PANMI|nr:hypothetical protein C2845_PM15G03370 [Panicum miliaceum]